jgi:hypothetical protein
MAGGGRGNRGARSDDRSIDTTIDRRAARRSTDGPRDDRSTGRTTPLSPLLVEEGLAARANFERRGRVRHPRPDVDELAAGVRAVGRRRGRRRRRAAAPVLALERDGVEAFGELDDLEQVGAQLEELAVVRLGREQPVDLRTGARERER